MRSTIPFSIYMAIILVLLPIFMAGLDLYNWRLHHDHFQGFKFSDFGVTITQYMPAQSHDIIGFMRQYHLTFILTISSVYIAALPSALCLVYTILSALIRLIMDRFTNHDQAHANHIPRQYRSRNFNADISNNIYGPSHGSAKNSKKSRKSKPPQT